MNNHDEWKYTLPIKTPSPKINNEIENAKSFLNVYVKDLKRGLTLPPQAIKKGNELAETFPNLPESRNYVKLITKLME